ncbi:cytochrome P450 4C1 [Bicyclus anynana]|uniref:Cytochrome P450 4C1 n=1 Tax=Bicyclus anynana TaxID=110368 RepID=A0A6J1NBT5_BICAN|nr:cytochrome P450 4C1 [Bicyclus anynana]
MLFYIVLIVCLLAILCVCDWFSRDSRLMRQIPGPTAWPIIGNVLTYLAPPDKMFLVMRNLHKEYGPITQVHAMQIRYVSVCEPNDLELVMSSSEYVTKADAYKFAAPWLGDSLLLCTGKKWHQRRKLLTKAFHFNILKKFMVTFKQHTQQFVKQVEEEILKEKTDVKALVGPAALRVISETAMGTSLTDDRVAFQKYFDSILFLGEAIITRLSKVWLHNDFIFNLSKFGKTQKSVLTELHGFTNKVIKNRRNFLDETDFKQDDNDSDSYDNNEKMALLDLLLKNERQGVINNEVIREEVDTFMFEGYDTTTIALSFFLMAIANEPAIQDKIYAELQQVMGHSQELPTMEELNDMKYLECCIKESLRLYPSVPFIGRKVTKEIVLSGYTVPVNTSCFIMIYDLHRRADLYPDPEKFDPDRFLPDNILKRHVYAYLPFSAGLRNCIGQKFAMLEMKMILSGLLRRFHVEPVTKPSDIVYRADIILRTVEPMYARFRLRR